MQRIGDCKGFLSFNSGILPEGRSVTKENFARTLPAVLELLIALIQEVVRFRKRVEELEAK